ncbi:MAG: peptide chain release factor 2 [candidate division WOR-3 bacterium]
MEKTELFEKWQKLKSFLNADSLKKEKENLERESALEGFWQDKKRAKEVMERLNEIKETLKFIEEIEKKFEELKELELLKEEDKDLGEEIEEEIGKIIKELNKKIEEIEIKLILDEPDDHKNCILTIHPGAGGTESMDWASMLLRMYLRFCERKGFKVEADIQPGEEAGVKSATLFIEGKYAYGLLKAERGVHRLVRISPFDASRRRHTSFAAVFVYPEVEEVEVEINEDDLEIETFRASGPGGQHVQKASTAIRIRHIPTGIVVSCQSERSLHQNRMYAMRILRARLKEYYDKKQKEKLEKLEKEKTDIAWGNQIRSYILHPYKLIKDHRTGLETGRVDDVLDGDIEEFIKTYLLMEGKNEGKENLS